MAKNILFTFEELTGKDKPTRELTRIFKRAGVDVAQVDVNPSIKRTSGITYRELLLTFADSQQVVLRIKQTGDVYQILLNGKVMPLRAQDDHAAAVAEVVKAMDAGRAAFQKKLAMVRPALPPSIRTAAPQMMQQLSKRRDDLVQAVQAVNDEITRIRAAA